MIELRWYEKLDGTKELQYRQVYDVRTDRPSLSGYAHFNATEWKKVETFKEPIKGISG